MICLEGTACPGSCRTGTVGGFVTGGAKRCGRPRIGSSKDCDRPDRQSHRFLNRRGPRLSSLLRPLSWSDESVVADATCRIASLDNNARRRAGAASFRLGGPSGPLAAQAVRMMLRPSMIGKTLSPMQAVNLTRLGYFEPVVATSSVFDKKCSQGRLRHEVARGQPSGLPDTPQPAAPLFQRAKCQTRSQISPSNSPSFSAVSLLLPSPVSYCYC